MTSLDWTQPGDAACHQPKPVTVDPLHRVDAEHRAFVHDPVADLERRQHLGDDSLTNPRRIVLGVGEGGCEKNDEDQGDAPHCRIPELLPR